MLYFLPFSSSEESEVPGESSSPEVESSPGLFGVGDCGLLAEGEGAFAAPAAAAPAGFGFFLTGFFFFFSSFGGGAPP